MPAPTAQDIINAVEVYLTQTSQMIVAGLPSGLGEADDYTITSNNQLLLWINEGANRVTRACIPIYDSATVTPAVAGQTVLSQFTQMISIAGRQLFSPSALLIGGKQLVPANVGFMGRNYWYPPDPVGNPTGWANVSSSIQLSPYSSQPAITVQGYFLPTPMTLTTSPLDPFIDDFAQRTIAWYVAWMVASKNADNSVLAGRIPMCLNEWVGGVKEMFDRMTQNDLTLGGYFPAEPIDSMLQLPKTVVPRS